MDVLWMVMGVAAGLSAACFHFRRIEKVLNTERRHSAEACQRERGEVRRLNEALLENGLRYEQERTQRQTSEAYRTGYEAGYADGQQNPKQAAELMADALGSGGKVTAYFRRGGFREHSNT